MEQNSNNDVLNLAKQERKEQADLIRNEKTLADKERILEILKRDPQYNENKKLIRNERDSNKLKKISEEEIEVRKKFSEIKHKKKLILNRIEGGEKIFFDNTPEEIDKNAMDLNKERIGQKAKEAGIDELAGVFDYVDNAENGFKMNPDGSVELPNGTVIASLGQANTCTQYFFDNTDASYNYKHLSGDKDILHHEVTYDNLQKVAKENNGILSHNGLTAILGGEEEMKKKLLDGVFPKDWSNKQTSAGLLYAAPQLFGVNHINASSPQVLKFLHNPYTRGVDGCYLHVVFGLIWVKNA